MFAYNEYSYIKKICLKKFSKFKIEDIKLHKNMKNIFIFKILHIFL